MCIYVLYDTGSIHPFLFRFPIRTEYVEERLIDASPSDFGIGNIVRIQLGFCAIPLPRKRFQMKILLKSMALENDAYSMVMSDVSIEACIFFLTSTHL